jgi:hypothetical protein
VDTIIQAVSPEFSAASAAQAEGADSTHPIPVIPNSQPDNLRVLMFFSLPFLES